MKPNLVSTDIRSGIKTSPSMDGVQLASDSTVFPNSDTLASVFKGYSTVFGTDTPPNQASGAELFLHNTLTKGCLFNWMKKGLEPIPALTNNTLATFTPIFSNSFPNLEHENMGKNYTKVPPEQRRTEVLKLFEGDYDRYLATFRNKLKLNAYELLLYRVSKEFATGEETLIRNNTKELFSEVSPTKTKEKISNQRRAIFSLSKDLLDLAKENDGLIFLLTGNCINLASSLARGGTPPDHVKKVLEIVDSNEIETFRSSILNIQYLNLIDKIQRDPTTTNHSGNPTLILTYIDEMTRQFDEINRTFSVKHGLSVENTLIKLAKQTLEDFDKAYEAEVKEIETIRARSLSSTSQSLVGQTAANTGLQDHGTIGQREQGIPDFPTFTPDTPSVIAARKNGRPTTTPAQANFNARRALLFGGGATLGFMGLGFAGWAAGLFGGNKPEEIPPVASNGNGGTTKVEQGTEVKTASEANKKKAELVSEIVKLKAEFSTYTETEDKEQVSKVYLNHGLNVTMASETELKKLSEEALRDIYVESLDASCRVQAKGELKQIDEQYGFGDVWNISDPSERAKAVFERMNRFDDTQKSAYLSDKYLKVLVLYLGGNPTEQMLRDSVNDSINFYSQTGPEEKDTKDYFMDLYNKYLNNEIDKKTFLDLFTKDNHHLFRNTRFNGCLVLEAFYTCLKLGRLNENDARGIPPEILNSKSVPSLLKDTLNHDEYFGRALSTLPPDYLFMPKCLAVLPHYSFILFVKKNEAALRDYKEPSIQLMDAITSRLEKNLKLALANTRTDSSTRTNSLSNKQEFLSFYRSITRIAEFKKLLEQL